MHAWQFAKLQHAAEVEGLTKFISMQNHYNLAYREEEREMIPLCEDSGVGVIPWSPLARGLLAGTRTREGERLTTRASSDTFGDMLYSDEDFDVVDAVRKVAERRATSMAQVALAWLLSRPAVTAPIVGRDQGGAPRRGALSARAAAHSGGPLRPRGAVPAALGARPRLIVATREAPDVRRQPPRAAVSSATSRSSSPRRSSGHGSDVTVAWGRSAAPSVEVLSLWRLALGCELLIGRLGSRGGVPLP